MADQTNMTTRIRRGPPDDAMLPSAANEADDPHADALFARVSEIVAGFDDLHARAVDAYRPVVHDILRARSRDIDHIDHILDGLLVFCGHDEALALFKKLCRYYWDIDPAATAHHVYAYREWFEEEA